jgi:DNA-binding CsgD family transcriptional regulator
MDAVPYTADRTNGCRNRTRLPKSTNPDATAGPAASLPTPSVFNHLAHEIFERISAEAFADRSRRELAAIGELVRNRSGGTLDDLSAQEAEIARMARDGYTNSQIGARLFISAKTVEWHLTSVFSQLQITSRGGLRQVLPDLTGATVSTIRREVGPRIPGSPECGPEPDLVGSSPVVRQPPTRAPGRAGPTVGATLDPRRPW